MPDAHSRLVVFQARVQPPAFDSLLDVDGQVAHRRGAARQSIEALEQVVREPRGVELVVPDDSMQVRIGLLQELVDPMRELYVGVATHLAEDGRALDGTVRELVELAEEGDAADVGHDSSVLGSGDSLRSGG
jgi:hypothetical protein